jgi:hypothetical protein
MNKVLKAACLIVVWTGVGCWVVTLGGVVTARTTFTEAALWGAGFALPIVIATLVLLARAEQAGRLRNPTDWIHFFLLPAAPTFFLVFGAAECRQGELREELLHDTGMDKALLSFRAPRPYADGSWVAKDGGAAYVRGKVAVVDVAFGRYSDLQHRLPKELVPAVASEVGTVIQVSYRQEHRPNRTSLWIVDIKVVDVALGVNVCKRTLTGVPTESGRESGGGGGVPDDEIASWIASLPRR